MSGSPAPGSDAPSEIDRRTFFRYGAQVAAMATAAGALPAIVSSPRASAQTSFVWEEATITELQAAMASGGLTSRGLTQAYLDRIDAIDADGPQINSVIEVNPDALAIASDLDAERTSGTVRGPLHGIPILVKDNIATEDRMETTAGSYALLGSVVPRDAFVADRLREAGAVILGKANLSEWANFRGFQSTSGWTGRAGVCLNPYAVNRNACGSSTGSAVAVAANLAASSLGTETDGSIICPASSTATVGIKPTLGLTSRSGVIPIAHSQDTVGPIARTVEDAAITLGAIVGVDPRDPATDASEGRFHTDYRPFLDPGALKGARLGVWRKGLFGFSPETDAVGEEAFVALKDLGATLVDPADIRGVPALFDLEFTVLLYEFKADLNAYLAGLDSSPVRTLAQVIAFNTDHADLELKWFGQELMEIAQTFGPLTDREYVVALRDSKRMARNAIKRVMDAHNLDAIVTVTSEAPWAMDLVTGDRFIVQLPSSTPAAVAGYPHITVPAGFAFDLALPVGLSFMGRAWQEPKLIGLAYAFEQGTKARKAPQFLTEVGSRDYVTRTSGVPNSRPGAGRSVREGRSAIAARRIGL